MRTVHVHIDRIAVDGLDETAQRQFAHSLQEQLRAWAASGAANGVALNALKIPALDAGMIKPGATAPQAAAQVINAVARRLGVNANGSHAPRAVNAGGKGARGHV